MDTTRQIAAFLGANRHALRFLLLFALIFGVCYFILAITPGVRLGVIKPFTTLLAGAVAAIVNLFGAEAVADGTMVKSPEFILDIAMGCDGVEASSLYLAGVLAYPTAWKAKLIGLALGVPLIQVINLGRLVGLYYAGIHMPSAAEVMHVYVAQTVVILFSTAILVFWLARVAIRPRGA